MIKNYINITFIIFLFFIISCAPKPAPLTTWHKIIKIEVDTPNDDVLISNGMPSGFFLITPQSSFIRNNTYYYDVYYTLIDDVAEISISFVRKPVENPSTCT